MTHIHKLIRFSLLLLLPMAGCMKQGTQQLLGVDEAWSRAQDLFKRERYYRAQEVLKDIVLNYPGSAVIDSAQFMLGRCSFEMADYPTATEEFQRVIEKYPFSKLVGDAIYYSARAAYEEAPSYQLDPDYTNRALQGFQRFLEEHPTHALADSGYFYLSLCRETLARKEYAAASLYYDLGEFASAVLYSDVILSNYYDTPMAGPAQYLKGRSFFALRDWERAQKELQLYLDKYPDGRFVVRARQMLETAATRTSASTATQQ
jgi:outer membrane protein assembly factor BamD